jgi:hypothetical protein
MVAMIENLEGRQMYSVSAVTPAAPSPVPVPYPVVVEADASSAKVTTLSVTIDRPGKSTPILFAI